jgi:SAM-dependent methyltransferase
MTPCHVQAQWAELTKLKENIAEVYNLRRRPLMIFDIGIGYARIPLLLSDVPTWNKLALYVGIDASQSCVAQARRRCSAKGILDKVRIFRFDAKNLNKSSSKFLKGNEYDLVLCTYFTAGNFRPKEVKLQTKENGRINDYDIGVLKPNKDFVAVFRETYDLLRESGRIVIGSLYFDNSFTRKIQEDFYKGCGMTVIISSKDAFTATREGFWSERFDQSKIYNYLSWIPKDRIDIISLDDYSFAFMVVIHK